ncbi:MAG: nucleotidyl transferase AbiEii/AbiGii toxin family protein [Gammaproteobacteria bacterium]
MTDIENFNQLVERAMADKDLRHMRPVVAKELLHYDILFSLDKDKLLDTLIFQGGTSLRLCYGSPRFSEDLDFVGGKDFSSSKIYGIKECIEKYIGNRYGLEIDVKEPSETVMLPESADIIVNKWQVRITTSPERKDLPKQKIKIEVVNVPAYSRVPQAIRQNYDFLPDGYEDTLVMVETLDEVMADKIVSLVACQRYVRHRDIWDLRWLKQQGANLNIDYVFSKVQDYRIEFYQEKLEDMINRLGDIIHSKPFMDEMSRFIPTNVQERTLKKDKFLDFLVNENKTLLQAVLNSSKNRSL